MMEPTRAERAAEDRSILCDLLERDARGEDRNEDLPRWLLAFCRRIVLGRFASLGTHCDDIIQKAVLKLLRNTGELLAMCRDGENVVGYAYTTVSHAALDYIRDVLKRPPPPPPPPPEGDDVSDVELAALLACLDELAEDDRRLLELNFGFHGEAMSLHEAADMLGITEAAARKRGQRARGNLVPCIERRLRDD